MGDPVRIDVTLATQALFPRVGAPVHVNFPRHDGDTPLHDHDFWEASIVLGGHAVHRSLHGLEQMARGDVVVLHPGQWHAWEGCRGLELANCCIGTALLEDELGWLPTDPLLGALFAGSDGQGLRRGRLAEDAVDAAVVPMRHLRRIQHERDLPARRAEHLGQLLLYLGQLAHGVAGHPAFARRERHPAVATATAAMREDLRHDWTLGELAALAECSEAYLVRLFRHHTGHSPLAWRTRHRAERAAVLLLTGDEPVGTIGARVGWHDPNYFARRFRSVFAQSPSAYRRQLPRPALEARGADWIQW